MEQTPLEESPSAVTPSRGMQSVAASRRIDPPHRATVLIRLPNVTAGQSGGRTLAALRQAWDGVLAFFKRLTQRKTDLAAPAEGTTQAKAQENRPMFDFLLKTTAGARMFAPLLQPLAAARRIPIPVIVAAVVSTALILHMTLSFNDAQPETVQTDEAPRWDDSQTAPPATAVAPANADGSTPAPTNPLAGQQPEAGAWSNRPADLGAGSRRQHDTLVGPAIPGVARLRGRIENISPTADGRYETYR